MSKASLYQQVVLDHYRCPHGRGALDVYTHACDGANSSCGDSLRIELYCVGDRVVEMGFSGESCAIVIATASMLSEIVPGKTSGEIAILAARFEELIGGGTGDSSLGSLGAMVELQHYPARRKCALLPWKTMSAALAGASQATTEFI